jgi:putative transposase
MIEGLSVQFAVKECCAALSVSRSGYYRWVRTEPSVGAEANAELLKQIRRVYDEHKGRYGSPRITQQLRQEGVVCGKNRVARLMRENELAARRKKAFRPRTTVPGEGAAPNLIKELEPSAPDQVWASDITYVATLEGWLYLAVILDLFSRRVVGWKLGESLEAELVVTALRNALVLRQPAEGLYFHSDRGSQYSSEAVRKPLSVIGANQSMSGVGNCYDNATMEAFFSTLKTECFPDNQVFASRAQARREIFEYIEVYYNSRRLHSTLGYQTPCQYETQFERVIDIEFDAAQSVDVASEDRALRGRNSSADAALLTAGVAASGRPTGRRPVLPEQAQSGKSQGVRGTESPDSSNNTPKKTENYVSVFSGEVHPRHCMKRLLSQAKHHSEN